MQQAKGSNINEMIDSNAIKKSKNSLEANERNYLFKN